MISQLYTEILHEDAIDKILKGLLAASRPTVGIHRGVTPEEVQHSLAKMDIVCDQKTIGSYLEVLVSRHYAELLPGRLYKITEVGERIASTLSMSSTQIAEERKARGMTLCVSESALDRWWSMLCGEVKADVFATYMDDLDTDDEEVIKERA